MTKDYLPQKYGLFYHSKASVQFTIPIEYKRKIRMDIIILNEQIPQR